MPNVDNHFIGYIAGEYTYRDDEGNVTLYDTTFVPDWKIDEVPSRVVTWLVTLAEQRKDRNNDEYLDDIKGFTLAKDPVEKDVLFGYTMVPAVGDRIVRCWYCANTEFSYREFMKYAPQAYEQERMERAFCYAMLEHYQEHRDANDLPYVTTYFPGRTIYRPNGEVAASKPGVIRTWQIKGGLLGPSQKWFDPTQRQESIAAKEEWAAIVE